MRKGITTTLVAATTAAGAWVATDVATTSAATPAVVAAGPAGHDAHTGEGNRRPLRRASVRPARARHRHRARGRPRRGEVAVTRRDGLEFDVYVSARGRVVKVVRASDDD